MIAYHAKADILPVFIHNDSGKTRSFKRNTVTFGKVIPFAELGFEKAGRAEYQRAADYIFSKVCELEYGEGNGMLSAEVTNGEDKNC